MTLYIKEGFSPSPKLLYNCGCHESQVVKVSSILLNLYVLASQRNPDLDDTIYNYLLIKMADVQDADSKACFVFCW